MMKFGEILKEIRNTYIEVEKAKKNQDAEIDRYHATFDGLTFKEKISKKKENAEAEAKHMRKIKEYQEAITDGKLKLKLLQNNARVALFHEVMPVALEVFQKYNGKPYGEKTEKKISDEINEKTGCRVYISSRYGSQEVSIIPTDGVSNTYNITCGTKYVNGENKKLLIDNKIQIVTMEDLELFYINRTYFEDLESTIAELKRLHDEAENKQNELKEICSQFNKLSVEGISSLDYTRYVNNII